MDGDGKVEIVVGSSVGFLYVLDGASGESKNGWPKQMAEIQAQVLAEDVDGDGFLEIVACDTKGSVACFDGRTGLERWEVHLGASITSNPTLGDVDGDGRLELVVPTGSGAVVTLDASTGRTKKHFMTNAMVMSPILLAPLGPPPSPSPSSQQGQPQGKGKGKGKGEGEGLHLAMLSFDGFLYLVDGYSGCWDAIDIGETSYAMPLLEDMDGDGRMELLVATMNGNVYAFRTQAKHHPAAAWQAQVVRKRKSERASDPPREPHRTLPPSLPPLFLGIQRRPMEARSHD